LTEKFIFTNDERILYNQIECANAYKFKNNALVLEFQKLKGYDVPKIEGIILLSSHNNSIEYDRFIKIA